MEGAAANFRDNSPTRLWMLIAALLLLIPSASLVRRFSDIPSFGDMHDDSLYYVSAKSLADGAASGTGSTGYRIESLPGEPAQTKYPPLYPLLLSVAWRIHPGFPGNLPIAAWLSWLAIPAIVACLLHVFPRMGFSPRRTLVLIALFALNPYVLLFGTQLLSEMLFLAFVLAAILMLERSLQLLDHRASVRLASAAGVVSGLAYLTRSAGIALLAAVILYLWIHRRRAHAFAFACGMLPFVISWMIWARLHQAPTNDPAFIYYLDYFRYQLYAVSLADLPLVLWKNADGLLWGFGSLIVPRVADLLFVKIFSQVIAVAMIVGMVRLVRQGRGQLYVLFALFSSLLLLVWHFPPNERFVLPMFPLALAGLLTEAEHFVGLLRTALRHKARDQRMIASAMIVFAGSIAVGILGLQLYVGVVYLPENALQKRAAKTERLAAYQWIRDNTPMDAAILSADDPALYLYTGRHAMRRSLPPALWYRADHAGMVDWFSHVEPFAQQHNLGYFDFAGVDISQGLEEQDREAVATAVATSTELTPLFRQGPVTLFGVYPPPASAAQLRTLPTPPTQ